MLENPSKFPSWQRAVWVHGEDVAPVAGELADAALPVVLAAIRPFDRAQLMRQPVQQPASEPQMAGSGLKRVVSIRGQLGLKLDLLQVE